VKIDVDKIHRKNITNYEFSSLGKFKKIEPELAQKEQET